MLKKSYSKTGKSCRVTFKLEPTDETQNVAVLGEFNGWSAEANPMKQRKDGSFSTTISLDAGQEYRFRYLMDGSQWENEEGADNLVANPFGTSDSLLTL